MFYKVALAMCLTVFVGQVEARNGHKYKLEVVESAISHKLPAASSLAVVDDQLYAISDESPYLYKLDTQFNIQSTTTIKKFGKEFFKPNGALDKKVKPDFESMSTIDLGEGTGFLIFGSGSKADLREWGYLVNADHTQVTERSLKPLYAQLHQLGNFTPKQEFNIEGLAIAKDKVYLLNRGNFGDNLIFETLLSEILEYMAGTREALDTVVVKKVILPRMHGFEAGLSGAAYSPELDSLVYTASIEAASNIHKKGYILGSFVGVMPLAKFAAEDVIDLTFYSAILQKDGKAVTSKVESVVMTEKHADHYKGMLVCDNDDGTSEFFKVILHKLDD